MAEHEECLRELLRAGQEAWPELVLPPALFMDHLLRHLPQGGDSAALRGMHIRELYLCCACAHGVPGALAAFERHYLHLVPGAVGHIDSSPEFIDEVRQVLREKLFVPQAGAPLPPLPKIADYSGTGSLASWVRIAALRVALDLRRSEKEVVVDDEQAVQRALPLVNDPEMDYIKDHYRDKFRAAFKDAFATLSPDQRNILRLHYIDGLNIDRIGAMLRVHRSTVARWLSSSCAQILDESRRLLRERLNLSPNEFDSLAGVIRSQLDLNIMSCLREDKR